MLATIESSSWRFFTKLAILNYSRVEKLKARALIAVDVESARSRAAA